MLLPAGWSGWTGESLSRIAARQWAAAAEAICDARSEVPDHWIDLLVAAADRCGEDRGAAFAALYASARQAECASPGAGAHSAETTDLLLHKIGVAQNLGPAAPSASARGDRS